MLSLDSGKLLALASDGWQPPEVDLTGLGALVETVEVPFGNYKENCYILGDRDTNSAAVIDPGGTVETICLAGYRAEVKY